MRKPGPEPVWRSWEAVEAYEALKMGFDRLAPTYDVDLGSNSVSERMREVLRRVLVETFSERSFLFEIGCGTGIDALWLARRGASIVAADISPAMLEQFKAKVAAEGLSERIRIRQMAAASIGTLTQEFGEDAFDGGYSHAGALNMEPQISRVPDGVHRLLRPGGRFVCSVINKTSLYELLFYISVLHPRKAFRRLGNVVPVPLSRTRPLSHEVVPARFYSGAEMSRLFRDGFELVSMRGLQIFLPPANLADEYEKTRAAFTALERLEDLTSAMPLIRLCGNHTLLVFRKT